MIELRRDARYYTRWAWIVPCITLALAFLGLDAAIALVRLVVCAAAIYLCWSSWGPSIQPMHVALIVLAVLFNPILPLWMGRGTWMLVDLVSIWIVYAAGRRLDAQAARRASGGPA